MNKRILFFFLLSAFITMNTQAQSPEETKVAKAVETMRKAMVDADKTALENISAEALTYGHSSGKIQDKKEFVDGIVSGQSDFVTIALTEQTIKISGDVALVRHRLDAETSDNGKPGSVSLYILLVWQKQHNTWKLLARQAVNVPK